MLISSSNLHYRSRSIFSTKNSNNAAPDTGRISMCIDRTIKQKTFVEQRWQQNIELRASRSFSLFHSPSLFFLFFATPLTVIDSPVLSFQKTSMHRPSLESKKQYATLAICFFFFFLSFSPVILVALSMDFNVECNKLRPREGWERASDGLKARVENPTFPPPFVFGFS